MAGQSLRIHPAARGHSKSVEKRQRILDAAARALAEHGYAEATLSNIAQQAGTHAGSLYYYFESRDALIKEALLASQDRIFECSDSLQDAHADASPLDRVLAFVRLVIDPIVAPDDYYLRAYMRNGNQLPDTMRTMLRTRRQRMRRALAQLLREAQAAQQIPAHLDSTLAAQFIIGAINWVGTWYEPTGPCSVDRITKAFVDLILHGIVGADGTVLPAPAPSKAAGAARKRRRMALISVSR